MNIVYGFGGLRSDKKILSINPTIIKKWNYYSFKINYHGSILKIKVDQNNINITNNGNKVTLKIYDKLYEIDKELNLELRSV